MDAQEVLDRINDLELELTKTASEIESLQEKQRLTAAKGKECLKVLYEKLCAQSNENYFAVGDKLVIVNRHYKSNEPGAVTIQPLTKI
jgi:uncharacterized coiled-coil protein SlyX